MLTNHPLSTVAGGKKLGEADLAAKLFVLEASKCRSDVTQLLCRSDELNINQASICTLPDIVKLDINMLSPVVVHWILDERDGGLVVHPQDRCAGLVSMQDDSFPA